MIRSHDFQSFSFWTEAQNFFALKEDSPEVLCLDVYIFLKVGDLSGKVNQKVALSTKHIVLACEADRTDRKPARQDCNWTT